MGRSKQAKGASALRGRLAEQAARIALDGAQTDLDAAKRKAAVRVGVSAREAERLLPGLAEIEAAIASRRSLFSGDADARALTQMRAIAREAMHFLGRFRPRLTGAVLDGSAARNASIVLHLFADPAEEVSTFLLDQGIPFDIGARRLNFGAGARESLPCYELLVDDVPLELIVFSGRLRTRQPLDATSGRAAARVSLAMLDAQPAGAELAAPTDLDLT